MRYFILIIRRLRKARLGWSRPILYMACETDYSSDVGNGMTAIDQRCQESPVAAMGHIRATVERDGPLSKNALYCSRGKAGDMTWVVADV